MTLAEEVERIRAAADRSQFPGKAEYYAFLYLLVATRMPKYILELGTGEGGSAAAMMQALPATSRLTTVNVPPEYAGEAVGKYLAPWKDDPRLRIVYGDTRLVRDQVDGGVDLLFIDSGFKHEYALISREWELYESALQDEALVCCDDIGIHDMPVFWDALPYEKVAADMHVWGFGVFRYKRSP